MLRMKTDMQNDARKYVIAAAFSAGLICLLVYSKSLWCGFVNLDDAFYVEKNPLINGLDGQAMLRLFTEPQQGAWLPLTIVSFAIDNLLWRGNPVGYHLTNILLHSANTVLVVLLADGLFRHLKVAIDARREGRGRFLMTGSQKFPLMQALSESLAGRCAVLELDTLASSEILAAVPAELKVGDDLIQPISSGNADLRLHQIHAGNHFSHRVLHLNAGIHLNEIEIPGLIHQ